jgi:hypothetical protein
MSAPYGQYPPPPMSPHGYAQQPPYAPPAPRNGFGITALCLALAGLVFGLVPFTGFIALILGAMAVLFGLLGLSRVAKGLANNRKMSIVGTVLGAGAVALGIWGIVIVFNAVDDLSDSLQGAPVSSGASPGAGSADAPNGDVQVAAFGGTSSWETGVQVTVQQPKAFRPSSTAAGADRARAVSFEVNVTNGSDAPLELATMTIQASFNGQPIDQIFDSAKDIGGTPSTSVLPGKSATFSVAYSLDKEPGELQLEVRPGFIADQSYFSGQV